MHSSHPTSTEGSPTLQTRLKDWRTHSAGGKTTVISPIPDLKSWTPTPPSHHLLGCSLTLAMPLVHTVLSLTESDQSKVIPCLGGGGHRALWAPRPGPHTWQANPNFRYGSRRGVLSEDAFLFAFLFVLVCLVLLCFVFFATRS